MRYALVDKKLAESFGFRSDLHKVTGGRMLLNENELLRIGGSPEVAAQTLGGELLSYSQIMNQIYGRNNE